MNWMPITKAELEREIEAQFRELNPEEQAFFRQVQVPMEKFSIERWGVLEKVFVVAKFQNMVVFYEDVEEGFEITVPNQAGVISDYSSSQFRLRHVVNQIRAASS